MRWQGRVPRSYPENRVGSILDGPLPTEINMLTPRNGNHHMRRRARSSPLEGEWIVVLVLMACVILPVAWLSVGWSREGADVTLGTIGVAVYAMFAAIWLPLAWVRLRRKEWLWFSSHILLSATGFCLLAAHLLPPSGPRFQLALLALACAVSALTLAMVELIAVLKRRFGEQSERIDLPELNPPPA